MVRKENEMRKAEGMRKVLLVSILFWVCLIVLSGCASEDGCDYADYAKIYYLDNSCETVAITQGNYKRGLYGFDGESIYVSTGELYHTSLYFDSECNAVFMDYSIGFSIVEKVKTPTEYKIFNRELCYN